jgi:hypothetical protein
MISGGGGRFSLPPKSPSRIEGEDLVYAPYMRFKGSIFQCLGDEIQHAIIDTTRLARASEHLPASLGLRPQAMKMLPVTADHAGHFLPQSIPPENIFTQAIRLTALFSAEKKQQMYHRAFIGETLSRIYLPLYHSEGVLYDAVTDLEIGKVDRAWDALCDESLPFQKSWEPRFLATHCPHCAAPLAGEPDALVLHCQNCERMWEEVEGRFTEIAWGRIPGQEQTDLAIPFWKITIKGGNDEILQSFADFLRLTNQPVIVRPEFESLPLSFWIPACKLSPAVFLQTAHYMTVSQRRIAESSTGPLPLSYPVNLSRQEAGQAMKSVVAVAALTKKTVLPLLPALHLQTTATSLVYLPFRDAGHDMIERQTSVVLNRAALKFGRKL